VLHFGLIGSDKADNAIIRFKAQTWAEEGKNGGREEIKKKSQVFCCNATGCCVLTRPLGMKYCCLSFEFLHIIWPVLPPAPVTSTVIRDMAIMKKTSAGPTCIIPSIPVAIYGPSCISDCPLISFPVIQSRIT
jgi:hypothetical protein